MKIRSTRTATRLGLVALAALTVSACATQTIYRPIGVDGARTGYAEQRIDRDRYRVSFQGNSITSRERVETALLLRAAELTRESGYDWFAAVERNTDVDTRYRVDSDPWMGPAWGPYGYYGRYWGPSWRYYQRGYWSPWGDPFWGRRDFDVRQVDRFEATAEIIMGRGAKPAGDPNAFDAAEVITNLGPRFPRPTA